MTRTRGEPDRRELPAYGAGSVEVPWVIGVFDEVVDRPTEWSGHSHPTHELLWNERGASSATVGRRTWTITPRLGLWMPAGTLHSARAAAGTWYRATHFSTPVVRAIADVPVVVEITPLLRLLLRRLEEPGLRADSRRITEVMVVDVLAPSPRQISVVVPGSELLRPLVTAIRANPGDRRSLADWAAELGVSARTITRAFRAETGTGFTGWVSAVRAESAVALLAAGEEIEDVAAEVGYSSVSAFGAALRKATGLTPGAFRR
ncbi:helix-turn-helix domain-containing protein [Microbacterium sp. No. 7]|uniref:helix-turn-helix domain-containing protein n=1 Tax=Microbacterium sp. No. 7 TaxID=1714373 RepID=UPI0006D1E3C2|nr:AraC family transcriptional regulator [Microbacterium sp. No. 7]ALJ20729.1 AraC family transcriptional regulator [Microbacterium sp. No. 7]